MVKIGNSLRNFRDRIRTSVSLKARNVLFFFAIFLIFVLAILIRITPVIRGPWLIKAFDPWIQWYNAEYLNKNGIYEYLTWRDYKSWYPTGFNRGKLRPGLTFTVVAIYRILKFFGIPISLYNVCFFFPAFMGGITCVATYFLGKEILDRGTGLLAAFFLAFNPGYMQRTMAGFFDNETLGVFATIMIFLFYLKGVRTGSLLYSILGGLFLGYLSLSWGGFQFVYLVLPLISIILVLTNKYNENVLITYAVVEATGLLIFSLYIGFDYADLFSSLETGGIFLFTIILVIFHIIQSKKVDHPKAYDNFINFLKWFFIPATLIFAVIIWIEPSIIPFGFGSRFQTIINPLFRENIALVASVAEQMPSAWSVFYYNTLIPLILVPLGIYFCFKRLYVADIFLILFVILMFYFTGSMIRIILVFAPAAALIGAYGLDNVLKIFGSFFGEKRRGVSRKRRRQVKEAVGNSEIFAVYLIVGFLCIAQVVHSSEISINQLSYSQIAPAGVIHDWEETLMYMRDNLPGTSVVVSWWDYGYWITPIGNMTTVNDNATMNSTRIGLTGMALMQTNEIYSAKAFRRLKADYVLVYFGYLVSGLGGDEGKWNWMVRIPNNNYAKYVQLGWKEDNWKEDAVFDENEYQNATNGLMRAKWFDSQLAKLLFFGAPTNIEEYDENDFRRTYASQIGRREVSDGGVWSDYIPNNGQYIFNAFVPEYISKFGLVKLYKVDYTILESSFSIKEPEVFDNDFANFKIKNTGTKNLNIDEVSINGKAFDFKMAEGGVNNTLKAGEEDIIWIDVEAQGGDFEENDVVSINVTAQTEALENRQLSFTNGTTNFFVKKALQGAIKINKESSRVVQIDKTTADVYLTIENIGESVEVIDKLYTYNNTVKIEVDQGAIEYLTGSPILQPGDLTEVYISNINASFYPIKTFNIIGVSTVDNITDELLFTSSYQNYSLSILHQERILSPEVLATINGNYRRHIPINLNNTYAYTYDNGDTILNVKVKNTGDIVFGIYSIYLTESLYKVPEKDFYTQSGDLILKVDEEDIIVVNATNFLDSKKVDLNVNDELLICVTGSSYSPITSDIGYVHTIKNAPDIQIIETIAQSNTSIVYANETGKVLVKNTGNELINIENIYINNTLISNIEYLYGSASLDIQECAIISFNIPNIKINKSDEVIVNVTTTSGMYTVKSLYAYVDSNYYNLSIDASRTRAFDTGNLTILINNDGFMDVTIDSIHINNTLIPLTSFFENQFEINVEEPLELSIGVNDLETIMLILINIDDKLEILVRTEEGAEATYIVIVK